MWCKFNDSTQIYLSYFPMSGSGILTGPIWHKMSIRSNKCVLPDPQRMVEESFARKSLDSYWISDIMPHKFSTQLIKGNHAIMHELKWVWRNEPGHTAVENNQRSCTRHAWKNERRETASREIQAVSMLSPRKIHSRIHTKLLTSLPCRWESKGLLAKGASSYNTETCVPSCMGKDLV